VALNVLNGQQTIGSWESHLSFKEAVHLADGSDRIYCATKSGLFFYHKTDHTVQTITKVEGLSDLDVSCIVWDNSRDLLVVAYKNTNIDLIEDNVIHNIPDIKRKQLMGNKTIHNSLIIGDFAYLSCGFGIVVLNLEKKEIRDTYYIGENGSQSNVYDMSFDGTWLYAATESGVYKADINSPNLIDYNNWSRISDLPYPTRSYSTVTWFGGRLYACLDNASENADSLYFYETGSWNLFQTTEDSHIYHVGESNGKLVVVTRNWVTLYNSDNIEIQKHIHDGPNHAIVEQDNTLWVADRFSGLIRYPDPWTSEKICPVGPLSNRVASIAVMEDNIYTVAGSVNSSWNNTFSHAEVNLFSQGIWEGSTTVDYRDLIHVSIDPGNEDHIFAASWGYGLLEYTGSELIAIHDANNSTLQSVIPGEDYCRLGGTVFDENRNLWVSNSGVSEPISVLQPDGTWISYNLDGELQVSALGRLINTADNHKWVLCHQGQGLFAFDVNATLDDVSDDSYRKFNVVDVNGNIISNYVYSFAEDKDGHIWVGTDKGIVVYYSPSRVFSEDLFYGQQIIVPRNDGTGLADILLQNERVNAIAIDGANRKWIGTSKAGVFLLSEDGLEEIHHFTMENSPLLSNNIIDITIDGNSGIVYVGTDQGLISYKSTAIEGKEFFSDVYVYPNPVREDYNGEIVITGLVGDVNVKITDIRGNLVYETTSLGGQAIWDGNTFSGDRVQTGVYMVFCTNEDGSQTHITKLLVIN
jgi:ligand-binding sensor domain-containing protein